MKSMTMAVMLIVISAAPTWGASIGLFADPNCASCNLGIPLNTLGTFYINYVGNEPIVAAEFRVVGLPTDWLVSVTPRPGNFGVLGDPFGVGVNIAFPEQIGECVGLFTVHVFSTRDVSDIHLRVTKHTTPSQPFGIPPCPWISLCWGPCDAFMCVDGGEMFINSAQECAVGVEQRTWSRVFNGMRRPSTPGLIRTTKICANSWSESPRQKQCTFDGGETLWAGRSMPSDIVHLRVPFRLPNMALAAGQRS